MEKPCGNGSKTLYTWHRGKAESETKPRRIYITLFVLVNFENLLHCVHVRLCLCVYVSFNILRFRCPFPYQISLSWLLYKTPENNGNAQRWQPAYISIERFHSTWRRRRRNGFWRKSKRQITNPIANICENITTCKNANKPVYVVCMRLAGKKTQQNCIACIAPVKCCVVRVGEKTAI